MHEMDWTVECFKLKAELWKGLAEASEGGGPRAYALRQNCMWGTWAGDAAATFKLLKDA